MENSIKLGFLGDFCPALIEGYLDPYVVMEDFKKSTIIKKIKVNDYNIGNLECPLTTRETKIKKIGPFLKCNPKFIQLIKDAHLNSVSLANNHIKDFGVNGITDTITTLENNGIDWIGVGRNKNERQKFILVEKDDLKVALISVAENEFNSPLHDNIGTNSTNPIDVYNQIIDLEKEVDHVIVFAHGGNEHFHYPSPKKQKLYRFYIDCGASAVIGTHTHCIQGAELYKGRPIYYSIGNFFFPTTRGFLPAHTGLFVQLLIKKHTIKSDIVFYNQCINNYRVEEIKNDDKQKVLDFFNKISEPIKSESELLSIWQVFLEKKQTSYLRTILPFNKYLIAALKKLGLLNLLINDKFILGLMNNLQCETHNENLLNVLYNKLYSK